MQDKMVLVISKVNIWTWTKPAWGIVVQGAALGKVLFFDQLIWSNCNLMADESFLT